MMSADPRKRTQMLSQIIAQPPLEQVYLPSDPNKQTKTNNPGFLLPNATMQAKRIASSKNLEHLDWQLWHSPLHLKTYFQGCDTGRKQCQLPLKTVNREASGSQRLLKTLVSILRPYLDGCHLWGGTLKRLNFRSGFCPVKLLWGSGLAKKDTQEVWNWTSVHYKKSAS